MDIKTILKKIETTKTPKVNKVAVAYSGGLDSSLAIELLRRKYKAKKILPITIDVGQGEEEIQESIRKAKVLRIKPLFFDLRKEFTEFWIAKAIQANSDYLGYPVSTSMTQQIVARWSTESIRLNSLGEILRSSIGNRKRVSFLRRSGRSRPPVSIRDAAPMRLSFTDFHLKLWQGGEQNSLIADCRSQF